MKKLFAAIAILSISLSASAQVVKKGTIVVNPTLTNVSYNSMTMTTSIDDDEDDTFSSSDKGTRMGFQVSGGYGLQDNLMLIASLGYQSGSSDGDSINATTLAAGAKYYFTNNIYATGTLNIANGTLNYAKDETKVSATGLSLGAGYSYFLSPKVSIDPSINYSKSLKVTVEDVDGFNIAYSGLTFNVGFTIFLF